jgi:hypothetical protein
MKFESFCMTGTRNTCTILAIFSESVGNILKLIFCSFHWFWNSGSGVISRRIGRNYWFLRNFEVGWGAGARSKLKTPRTNFIQETKIYNLAFKFFKNSLGCRKWTPTTPKMAISDTHIIWTGGAFYQPCMFHISRVMEIYFPMMGSDVQDILELLLLEML